jgi:hypothetical protein
VVLGLFMRSQAITALFSQFLGFGLVGYSLSMVDINIQLSYHLNIKHFSMVLNLGFVFLCTISDDN